MGLKRSSSSLFLSFLVALFLVLSNSAVVCNAGETSSFVRREAKSVDMPLHSDVFQPPSGYNAPQQVHITLGDQEGSAMIVSWVTMDEPGSSEVVYWKEDESSVKKYAHGKHKSYKFHDYTSGYIHHCTIRKLEVPFDKSRPSPSRFTRSFSDLGQTFDSNITLTHYEKNPRKPQALLFAGDLSYADNYPNHDQHRWDTWGRFVERSVAYQPWIWCAGNHELDFVPEIGETQPFKPYLHRFHVPFKASGSTSPLWYSVRIASAHIIVLSSYSAYGKYTPQYQWLKTELTKVNRTETPWLIVMLHSPWYNSYDYHYMEGETMRVMFESWLVDAKVDLVIAGHVHGYERSERVSNVAYNIVNKQCSPVKNQSAPVYLTIGDGGNVEGLANKMTEPQPEYSAFREASFGHAILDIKNRTHAHYSWHRNQDGYPMEADTMWFYNRYWHPVDESRSN
ncbi:unnamed protein product [Linum tenue]|uniref:Purple acid phosphatase n=1 Tax=Linum tenue TaxID=586396 RepID=A0AAV0GZ52_9ROSI|nr:unnamed protein product [Linum tenue]